MPIQPHAHQLIIALDYPSADEALALVRRLAPLGVTFKVGMQLFYQAGMSVVNQVQAVQAEAGFPSGRSGVFLDLKLHDIPNTVAKASETLVTQSQGGVFFNLHALGGPQMMRAAVESARQTAQRLGKPKPLVIGVTILTSMSQETLTEALKIHECLETYVVHLATSAQAAGLDGVVCSAQEARLIANACGPDFLKITPGIRLPDYQHGSDDQSRVMTPAQALAAGATHLVVGRPITAASDPLAAAQTILADMLQTAPVL